MEKCVIVALRPLRSPLALVVVRPWMAIHDVCLHRGVVLRLLPQLGCPFDGRPYFRFPRENKREDLNKNSVKRVSLLRGWFFYLVTS